MFIYLILRLIYGLTIITEYCRNKTYPEWLWELLLPTDLSKLRNASAIALVLAQDACKTSPGGTATPANTLASFKYENSYEA